MYEKELFLTISVLILIITLIITFLYCDLAIVGITILVITIIILAILFSRLASRLDYPENIYKKELKEGDMIFVSYSSSKGKMVKFFTKSCWTHCCLVLKLTDDELEECGYCEHSANNLYVLEMANYRNKIEGITLRPLRKWLKWNKGRVIGVRPCNKYFPRQKCINHIKKTNTNSTDFFVLNWLKTLVKRKYNDDIHNKKNYYCSEYIVYTLQEIDILEKEYIADGYKPYELLYGEIPQKDTYYDECYLLK